ncbi:hypothetical protein TorRG33x02_078650, partial [Trema orientale]
LKKIKNKKRKKITTTLSLTSLMVLSKARVELLECMKKTKEKEKEKKIKDLWSFMCSFLPECFSEYDLVLGWRVQTKEPRRRELLERLGSRHVEKSKDFLVKLL